MTDSPDPRSRKMWRAATALACLLGATGILLSAILSNRVQSNTTRNTQAVCAIIEYSEDALDAAQPPKTKEARDALERFRTLIREMRATGVDCPPHEADRR